MSVHFHSFLKTTLCRAVARFLIVVLVVVDLPTNLGVADTPAPAIRYVNNSDATCQGQSPCYPTMQAGVSALQAGETLLIQAGTYDETVLIANKNTSAGASEADRIVILADPSAPVGSVVLGSRRPGKCVGGNDLIRITAAHFVTLRGLTLRDASQWAITVGGGEDIHNRAVHLERNSYPQRCHAEVPRRGADQRGQYRDRAQ